MVKIHKPAECVVMVAGKYRDMEAHIETLKSMSFRWNPEHKAWFSQSDMDDNAILSLSRKIGSIDVEVRRVKRSFVDDSE